MGLPSEIHNLLCSWPPSDSQNLAVVLEFSHRDATYTLAWCTTPDTHKEEQSSIVYAVIQLQITFCLLCSHRSMGQKSVTFSERWFRHVIESGYFGVCVGL